MYVPRLGIEPTTLACQDDAPADWATWPGPPNSIFIESIVHVFIYLLQVFAKSFYLGSEEGMIAKD